MRDARHVANEFIRRSKDRNCQFTPMQIQKLVYFAHARMLSLHRRPLISQTFEPWPLGPVVPVLYRALSRYGGAEVRSAIQMGTQDVFTVTESDVIGWSFDTYGHLSGPIMSDLTHAPDAPWARAKGQKKQIIPDNSIERYYLELWQEELIAETRRISALPDILSEVKESARQFERGEYVTRTSSELKRLVARAGTHS